MMNKAAQYYRELVSSLSERLRHGERDIDALATQAREKIVRAGDLTQSEIESVIAAGQARPRGVCPQLRRESRRRERQRVYAGHQREPVAGAG